MYRREKVVREDKYRHRHELKNPSFSSSLLDEIYRSIDQGDTRHDDLKFYRETTVARKHNRGAGAGAGGVKSSSRGIEHDEGISAIRRACLIQKWMEQEVSQKPPHKGRRNMAELENPLFFSSTSSSSGSSSGGFSSSDTESIYAARSRTSLAPPRPKPVRTSVEENTNTIKSKSRALKIYSKVKQPISPGGKLANFINSLFTPKKSNNTCSEKSAQEASTCSSASSFSRSCLSKHSPATREKLRNGVKRTVRFYPVSVIVDEDCRPCGHKTLYQEEEEESSLMSVSLPTAWKIGKSSASAKLDQVVEKSRELLKDYNQNLKKNELIMRDVRVNYSNSRYNDEEEEEEEDDDVESCSSSDLFELDHLAEMGNNRYCQELPVYETTHLHTNRAIANGFLL